MFINHLICEEIIYSSVSFNMFNSNKNNKSIQNNHENCDWKIYTEFKENCKYLDIGRCSISHISENVLVKLQDIQYLYLEGNELSELSPAFFPSLKLLKWIDLRNNKLKQIPKTIMDHPSLQVFLLEGNHLETIPVEVGSLKALRGLQLARNPLKFPPKSVINEGVQSILDFLRKQWQQVQSPQQIQLISETHSKTKIISSQSESGRKPKAATSKSAVMVSINNKIHQRPRKVQSGLCAANLSKCISVQPISRHNKQKPHSFQKWSVNNDGEKVFNSPYHERKSDRFSKKNTSISLRPDNVKSNTDSELHSKFLRDIWIEKVREMLLKQEAILQKRRNAKALHQWQQEARKMQDTQKKTDIIQEMTFPYDTEPEYLKMLSRKDLKANGGHKSRDSSVHNLRHEEPINNNILSIMAALQDLHMGPPPASVSPRSEQRILGQEIKKIKDIQRSLNALKLKNFGQIDLT